MSIYQVLIAFLVSLYPAQVFAAWTPLIQATDFDGIRTDVLTSATGIISIFLIIIGLGILIRNLSK